MTRAHTPPITVNLVVALEVEAKAVADAWMLKRMKSGPFTLYQGELPGPRNPVRMLVCGVGRAAAAAGVAWLAGLARHSAQVEGAGVQRNGAQQRQAPAIWLNYGVAGAARLNQRDAVVGDIVIAAKVVDEERRRAISRDDSERSVELAGPIERALRRVPSWYPPWLLTTPEQGSFLVATVRTTVRTVDRPELAYPDPGVYEMEAAAFVEMAARFATAELVQVVKVVSDTPAAGLNALDREVVTRCAQAGVGVLGELGAQLVALSEGLPQPLSAVFRATSEQTVIDLGLTVAQRHLWNRQVERLVALAGEDRAASVLQQVSSIKSRAGLGELQRLTDGIAAGQDPLLAHPAGQALLLAED